MKTLLLALAAFVSCAVAQVPKAPSQLCLDDDCVSTPEPALGKKWNPGHYMQVLHGDFDTVQINRFAHYDKIGTNRAIEGVGVFYWWAQLEGARGDYSAGIALIRAEVAKLKSLPVPKRLAIRVLDANWGTTLPASKHYPAYLYSTGKLIQTPHQVIWKKWDAEAMGWFIDLLKAYAEAFDDEPYVEIISPMHETAIGWGGMAIPAEYTEAKLDTQYRRLASELRHAWTRTNVWIPTNWGLSQAKMAGYVEYLRTVGVGAGNPDICPSCNMYVDGIIRGVIGLFDFRGHIPNVMCVEVSEMGNNTVGPDGGFTAQQIYDYANGRQRVTHLFWTRNNYAGTPEQRWDTGILPVINANPIGQQALPLVYSAPN